MCVCVINASTCRRGSRRLMEVEERLRLREREERIGDGARQATSLSFAFMVTQPSLLLFSPISSE